MGLKIGNIARLGPDLKGPLKGYTAMHLANFTENCMKWKQVPCPHSVAAPPKSAKVYDKSNFQKVLPLSHLQILIDR